MFVGRPRRTESVRERRLRAEAGAERVRAECRALIGRITPFREWLREAPRSPQAQELYRAILRELAREVAHPTPSWLVFESGRLINWGF